MDVEAIQKRVGRLIEELQTVQKMLSEAVADIIPSESKASDLAQQIAAKTGTRIVSYRGALFLTDNRLLFQSPEKSFSVKLRSMLSYRSSDTAIHCQFTGKPDMS